MGNADKIPKVQKKTFQFPDWISPADYDKSRTLTPEEVNEFLNPEVRAKAAGDRILAMANAWKNKGKNFVNTKLPLILTVIVSIFLYIFVVPKAVDFIYYMSNIKTGTTQKFFKEEEVLNSGQEHVIDAIDLPDPQGDSQVYGVSYSFWLNIVDLNKPTSVSVLNHNNNIKCSFQPNTTNLEILVKTQNSPVGGFDPHPIIAYDLPMEKWIHLTISIKDRKVNLYLNGYLIKSRTLDDVAMIEYKTHCTIFDSNTGLSIKNLQYFPHYIKPEHVKRLYKGSHSSPKIWRTWAWDAVHISWAVCALLALSGLIFLMMLSIKSGKGFMAKYAPALTAVLFVIFVYIDYTRRVAGLSSLENSLLSGTVGAFSKAQNRASQFIENRQGNLENILEGGAAAAAAAAASTA